MSVDSQLTVIVIGASVLASVISGMFGMAGGMVLMGIYSVVLPVASAMILHGITQFSSNGFRWLILRKHTYWRGIIFYVFGALLTAGVFSIIMFVPQKAVVYLALGSLPFLAAMLPRSWILDFAKPGTPFLVGSVVTGVQLIAGAAGPALDIFFIDTKLSKLQIVATKALTQSISHATKVIYFSFVVSLADKSSFDVPTWLAFASVVATFLGTSLGNKILARFSETQFRKYTRMIVMLIGAYYLLKGSLLIFNN